MIEWIGTLAGLLTTISFLPQVYRVWKTRSTHDISLGMYLIFCAGVFLWIIYGIFKESLPMVIANVCTFALAASVLLMKLMWENPGSRL